MKGVDDIILAVIFGAICLFPKSDEWKGGLKRQAHRVSVVSASGVARE